MSKEQLVCDTCGREAENLRRDVVDVGYNALSRPPMWNCDECYEQKRRARTESSASK